MSQVHPRDCQCVNCKAMRSIDVLAAGVSDLADVVHLLDQKSAERNFTTLPIIAPVGDTQIIGGEAGARILVVSYVLVGRSGFSAQWLTGKGRNLGQLSGLMEFNGTAEGVPPLQPTGSFEAPLLISGVAEDIWLRVLTQAINGHITYTTIETGP